MGKGKEEAGPAAYGKSDCWESVPQPAHSGAAGFLKT
jgi:hypothetical protein